VEQFQMKKPPRVKPKTKKKTFGNVKTSVKPVENRQGGWAKFVSGVKSVAKAGRTRIKRAVS